MTSLPINLTGLPLRKAACEVMDIRHSRFCTLVNGGLKCDCRGMDLPAIESDPGVSVSTLDKFCKKRGLEWTLSGFLDGITNCALFRMVPIFEKDGMRAERIVDVDAGPNPCEAIARAIVAAGRKDNNV